MTELLLCVNIVVLLMLGAVNMTLYIRMTRSDREKKADDKVQEAMDEGFDNVMSYSVKLGHGKTTGGEP